MRIGRQGTADKQASTLFVLNDATTCIAVLGLAASVDRLITVAAPSAAKLLLLECLAAAAAKMLP